MDWDIIDLKKKQDPGDSPIKKRNWLLALKGSESAVADNELSIKLACYSRSIQCTKRSTVKNPILSNHIKAVFRYGSSQAGARVPKFQSSQRKQVRTNFARESMFAAAKCGTSRVGFYKNLRKPATIQQGQQTKVACAWLI